MFESCFNQITQSLLNKSIIGFCGGVVYQLVGLEVGWPLMAVYGLVLADMAAGTIAAWVQKKFTWKKWGTKFAAKVMSWSLLIFTAHQLTLIEPNLKFFEGSVFLVLGATDAWSILKNAKRWSSSVPSALIDGAKRIKDKADNIMTKP